MAQHPLANRVSRTGIAPFLGLFVLLILAAVAPPVPSSQAAIEVGTAVKVVKDVFARNMNRKVKRGDGMPYLETVLTGEESATDILLIDESTLVIGELSEITLDSLVYKPNKGVVEGSIEAIKGVFRFSSAGVKMDLRINTPVASIGVRGTEFDVLAAPTTMEVSVHEGTIEVTSASGTEEVSEGQVYSVTANGGAFQPGPSPELERAVGKMLAALASQEASGAGTSSSASATQSAAVQSPAASASASQGPDLENMLYASLPEGSIVIELRPDLAPESVKRVKELARRGFYDGLDFHFVRTGYVAETGDPTGTGQGGSGQPLKAEISDIPFERGVVGMSRSADDPDSADSQFFITLGRAAHLDGKYTVIGRVVSGLEFVDALATGKPPKNPDKLIRLRVAADVKN